MLYLVNKEIKIKLGYNFTTQVIFIFYHGNQSLYNLNKRKLGYFPSASQQQRAYLGEHELFEVKQHWARLVLGWVTASSRSHSQWHRWRHMEQEGSLYDK